MSNGGLKIVIAGAVLAVLGFVIVDWIEDKKRVARMEAAFIERMNGMDQRMEGIEHRLDLMAGFIVKKYNRDRLID